MRMEGKGRGEEYPRIGRGGWDGCTDVSTVENILFTMMTLYDSRLLIDDELAFWGVWERGEAWDAPREQLAEFDHAKLGGYIWQAERTSETQQQQRQRAALATANTDFLGSPFHELVGRWGEMKLRYERALEARF